METILYAEIYGLCTVILAILYIWSRVRSDDSSAGIWFRRVLITFLANFVSNFFFRLFNVGLLYEGFGYHISYFIKTVYFLTFILGVFAWCGYSECVHSGRTFFRREHYPWVVIAMVIPAVVTIVNLKTHHLFCINDRGIYERHFMYHGIMIYAGIWVLFFSARAAYYARKETDAYIRHIGALTASFPIGFLAAWLLSFTGENIPAICICITIQLLCIYIGDAQNQISLDKLTRVNNRQNLIGYMNYKVRNHSEDLWLLMLDIDYFKDFNDTYGHLEGDYVLMLVAGALKAACGPVRKRPYIARYGGDEFMILAELSETEVRDLCRDIQQTVDERSSAGRNYHIRLSIGIARWEAGMSARDLIGAADAELYKAKRSRPPRRR